MTVRWNDKPAYVRETCHVCSVEVDDGIKIQKIKIDCNKSFAVVLLLNAGNVTFYDINGNTVEYFNHSI